MKPQTQDQAAARICPFTFGDARGASKCMAGFCMAWRVVHPAVTPAQSGSGLSCR